MTSLLWLAVLGGCGSNSEVYERYQVAKRQALQVAPVAPSDWKPDVRLEIAPELLDKMITFGLERQGAFSAEVSMQGVGRATPELTIEELVLRAAPKCASCFTVELTLAGHVRWKAGLLGEGRVPARGGATFEVELETERDGKDFVVEALPRDVRNVSIEVPGWSGALKRAAIGPIERWLNQQVEKIEPVAVTRFGGDGLPLRAIQVKPRGKGLTVLMSTDVATPGEVRIDGGRIPRKGFIVLVAYDTLVGFGARQAFEQGPQDYDIVAVPTSLTAKRSGFTLGLRLWGLGGAGWWRDYQTHGGIRTEEGEVRLSPKEVKQVAMSNGAIQADPLIHLGQSLVLDSITEALKVAIPTVHQHRSAGTAARVTLTGVAGEPTGLQVFGDLDLQQMRGSAR